MAIIEISAVKATVSPEGYIQMMLTDMASPIMKETLAIGGTPDAIAKVNAFVARVQESHPTQGFRIFTRVRDGRKPNGFDKAKDQLSPAVPAKQPETAAA